MRAILETPHGSRLYGLGHAGSDYDLFVVVDREMRTKQTIVDNIDTTVMSLSNFIRNISSGSHQSCEALFSPLATIHPDYERMFANYKVTGESVFYKYRRTIRKFAYGDMKQRRHAVRLGYNLGDLRRYGRFNPQLTDDQVTSVRAIAHLYKGRSLYELAYDL